MAKVKVECIEDETSWSPYLSLEDARRLDQVREALSSGDVKTAVRFVRVYTLNPVAVV